MVAPSSPLSLVELDRERAEIYAAYGLTCPPRFATLRRMGWPTYGPKVARVAAQLGHPFMPWQRYVADTMLEVDPRTGLLWYRRSGCAVMRQCGKTTLVLPWFCWRGLTTAGARMSYAAQNHVSAKEKFEDDQLPILERANWVPEREGRLLSHHKARVRREHGREGLVWRKTRAIHYLHAGTERAGHGKTKLYQGAKDEFFSQVDNRIDVAWGPAGITIPDFQNTWWSAAGTSRSVPMNEAMTRGRELVAAAHPDTRTAYFEWSRPPDADRADRRVWLATIPGLCPDDLCLCDPAGVWHHAFSVSSLAAELEAADTRAKLADFDRAYGTISREDDMPDGDPHVPTVEQWDDLGDPDLEGSGGPTVCLAIDVSPQESSAAIMAVGEGPDGPSGPPLVVVLEHGPGIDWVVPATVGYVEELTPVAVVVDDKSATRVLLTRLENAKIITPAQEKDRVRGQLWRPVSADVAACAARFAELVRGRGLRHLRQRPTRLAVAGAASRSVGDGLWMFGRRSSSADITPIVGGSLALGGWERFAHLATVEQDYDLADSVG